MPYKDINKKRESQRRVYLKNKEAILLRNKEWYKNHPELLKAKQKRARNQPVAKLRTYKKHASDKKIEFCLTSEEFTALLISKCHYCGKENALGVDRKQNASGYLSNNVVACCSTCNYMKGKNDYCEFLEQIKRIIKNLSLT